MHEPQLPAQTGRTPPASGPVLPAAERATVLIVDDDPAARLLLATMIAPLECRIVLATGATGLQQRLERIRPDVIVCDVVMDDVRGDELFRGLKGHEVWRWIPLIAVTRLDNPVVRADLLQAGADWVLSKACEPVELRAWVGAALRIRGCYRELQAPEPRDGC